MKVFQSLVGGWLAAVLLAGCGGGGGGDAPASGPLTGVFVDAPVQGLTYKTATQTGTTGPAGEFTYMAGETVEFKAGALSLGQSTAGAVVTPVDLVPGATAADSSTPANTKVQNIVRFLLASHTGGASGVTSSIVLNDTAKKAAAGSIDFAAAEASFVAAVQTATGATTVPTAFRAQTHMGESLGFLKVAGDYSGTFTGTTTGSSSGTWKMTIDKRGNITGTATDIYGTSAGTGTVTTDGIASFGVSGGAYSSGAGFTGSVTAGTVSGQWVNGIYRGTFTGKRTTSAYAPGKLQVTTTAAAQQTTSTTVVSQQTTSTTVVSQSIFNIQAANANSVSTGYRLSYSVSGNVGSVSVSGSGTITNGSPKPGTFNGRSASSVSVTTSGIVNGQTTTSSCTNYYDADYSYLGEQCPDNRTVFSTISYPTAARVGDTGTVATFNVYDTNSNLIATGQTTYSLSADTATAAILSLTTKEVDTSGSWKSTDVNRIRITTSNTSTELDGTRSTPTDSLTMTFTKKEIGSF